MRTDVPLSVYKRSWGENLTGLTIIAPLVLVVVLGMILRQTGFLVDSDKDRLTKLLYWVVLPALLFRTTYLAGGDLSQHKNLFMATYASYFIVPIIALGISSVLDRGNRKKIALSAMSSARANNLYLGMPAVFLALGDPGMEAASVYMAIALPGYNLVSIMWGEALISGGISFRSIRAMASRVANNPLIAASVLGLAFAQIRIPVPETLLVTMQLVGNMATGIALIALGISLRLRGIPDAIRRTWPDVLIKLFLHPAVVWGLLMVWPVPRVFFQAAMIISAMPTAINTFILASGMGMDEHYASELVAITTLLAPISIPIWIALIGI